MIKVRVKKLNNKVVSFSMVGHAEAAEHGKDLVCAGASAVSFGGINALFALTDVTPIVEQKENGYLKCTLPDNLSEENFDKASLLLESIIVSLQTIERDYNDYIQVSFH